MEEISIMSSTAAEFLTICREAYPKISVEDINGEVTRKTMKLFNDLTKCSQLSVAKTSISAEDEVDVFSYIRLLMHHHEVRVLQEVQKLLPRLFSELHFDSQSVLIAFEGLLDMCIAQIEKHRFRSETTRKTALGSVEDISLDSITGYVHFEQALFSLHLLLFHALQHNLPVIFRLFLTKSINCIGLFDFLLETNAAHENRHINEQLMFCLQLWCYPPHPTLSEQLYHEYNYFSYDSFVFMLSGVNCVALDNLDMFLPAACKDKLAYNIIKALGLGLQDAFPQVRLAATKACYHLVAYLKDKEVLRKLKSQEQAVDREDWRSFNLIKDCNPAMAEYVEHSSKKDQLTLSALLAAHLSSIIMPRVLLNVFYPAESIQNVSQVIKNELMGARDGRPLYSYPSLFHSAQYYVHCTKHGNHNIVEAACYALCQLYVTHSAEIISRGDVDGALEGGLGVFYASLTDQRWPVGDSAILTSAQLLYRYASYLPAPVFSCPILPKRSTLTGVVERSPWPQLFLTSYLGYLRHGIPTVRSHALQALTLLLRHADWEEEIGIALDQYVNTYLLQALQSTTAKIISSFLPPTMLEKYRTPGSGEVIRSDVRMEARVGLDKDIGQVKEVKGTRSWDCCIDCQDLRSVSPAEVTGGVLDLCKELCSKWGMHVYTKKRDLVIENDEIYRKLSSQFSSPSGPQYGKLHMCILQALLLLVGDGLEGVARITINETQEIVYKQLSPVVLQCVKSIDSDCSELVRNFLSHACSMLARDVKTRQAEIEVESAAAFNVTNARRVVHSANTSGSTGSRSNLAATTATVRRVRNDEAIKKAFIFSTAKQVRDAIETYDSALLGDLANVNV